MKKFEKGNLKILYNETMWSPEKSKKIKVKIGILSFVAAFLFCIIMIIPTITLDKLPVGNIIKVVLAFCFEIVCAVILLIGALVIHKKFYGEYDKLYNVLDYLYQSENMVLGVFNNNFLLQVEYDGQKDTFDFISLLKRKFGNSLTVNNNLPKNYGGSITAILDVTKYPNCSLSIEKQE